jgi:hypothetical protein
MLLILVSLFALNATANPSFPSTQVKKGIISVPGFCEIEVANQSHLGAWVDIQYDNGSWRYNNYVYPVESLMIPLDYPGYCRHSYAWLNVYSSDRYLLYSGYVYVGHTITVVPALNKAKMSIKHS